MKLLLKTLLTCTTVFSLSFATNLNLSNSPLSITQAVPPLTMLVVSPNFRMFTQAYNNASSLNNNGVLNIDFTPSFSYYGYFDPNKCYSYSGSTFVPSSITSTGACNGSTWSGNWLNWATMTKMDILRKVLYGGYRSTDSTSSTVLQRINIVQDAHSWGRDYTSPAVNGYSINQYTPYTQPAAGKYLLFANTTLMNNADNSGEIVNQPLLRVVTNSPTRIWDWVTQNTPNAGQFITNMGNVNPTDYIVNVQVCKNSVGLESNCQAYTSTSGVTTYKPTGLLQQFGENNSMLFGLLTRSYDKNLSGGILRKNISSFTNEVNLQTGQFINTPGIVQTLNAFSIVNYDPNSYTYNNSLGGTSYVVTRPQLQGEFQNEGNPIAGMMYETLRYFAGKTSPTASFYSTGGTDGSLGLPTPAWVSPWAANPYCSKANMIVLSDLYNSYDSNSVTNSYFGSFSGDLNIPNQALGQTIWNTEVGGTTSNFIGQSGSVSDNAPTPKNVSSYGNIRGLAPEEPTKQGSYYPATLAYYGWMNDLNPSVQGTQNVATWVVAMGSGIPHIQAVVNGKTITIIPFAKSVGGCGWGIDPSPGAYQPTNRIAGFYVQSLTATSGSFLVIFDDNEFGADFDLDDSVLYNYQVNSNGTVTVSLTDQFASGCLIQHAGYVISGTTADGVYLETRNMGTPAGSDISYFLDTPPGHSPGQGGVTAPLPTSSTRTFTPGTSSATFLPFPLFLAAKWGNFTDLNKTGTPDQPADWDNNGDGIPDAYFSSENPGALATNLATALTNISLQSSSAASATVNGGSLNTNSQLFLTLFNSNTWYGQVLAFPINPTTGAIVTTGSATNNAQWDSSVMLNGQNFNTGRNIISYNPTSKLGVPFRWATTTSNNTLTSTQQAALNISPITGSNDSNGQNRLNYLRGDRSKEVQKGGIFRNRTSVLGDIVNSGLAYVGAPGSFYPDFWGTGAAENASLYSAFVTAQAARQPMLYVGANDGMLHGFNATTGAEALAYVPNAVFSKLNQLTNPAYSHLYYVDGTPNVVDAFLNGQWRTILATGLNAGGKGIVALDVTTPSAFTETNASSIAKWEFSELNDLDMGYSFSQPAIVREPNGVWVAIFGNGYNNTFNSGSGIVSTTGNAVLYIVNLNTGALIQKISTGQGMAQDPTGNNRPNGLSTPVVISATGGASADTIYAGDLFGNLWKFYWTGTQFAIATYGSANPTPFFTAIAGGKRQPITVRPNVLKVSQGYQVYFGTGTYFQTTDNVVGTNPPPQSFYGLIDKMNVTSASGAISGRSNLLQQQILSESTASGQNFRVTTQNVLNSTQLGWYIDLIPPNGIAIGERVVNPAILRNGSVIFVTTIPSSSPCTYGGTSWLMEINALTGSRLNFSPFDVNNNGILNTSDLISYNNSNVTVSGIQSSIGVLSNPAIFSGNGVEHKYSSSSSGQVTNILENPGSGFSGRSSWHEIR